MGEEVDRLGIDLDDERTDDGYKKERVRCKGGRAESGGREDGGCSEVGVEGGVLAEARTSN